MINLFAWSPPVPRWLAGVLLLGLLAAAAFLLTGFDHAALKDLGSWRWPQQARVG
jgi:ABC-type uncharacterized transport system permease subunit